MHSGHLSMRNAFLAALSALVVSQAAGQTVVSSTGNIELTAFGKSSVNYGDQTPWSVLNTIQDNCSDGSCSATSWTIPTTLTRGPEGSSQAGTITVSAIDATYQTWARTALVETLKTLSSQAYTVEHTTYMLGGSCQVATGTPCDPGTPTNIDQYSSADTFYIRMNAPDGSPLSELRIGVSSSVDDTSNIMSTFCKDLTTTGAGISSVMGGTGVIVAAGFTLASIACGN